VAIAALAAALAASAAHAEPEPATRPMPLAITHEPPPRHLRMRPRAAAVPPPPSRPAVAMPAAPHRLSELDARDRDELAGLRDVLAPVSFSITVGYQVDGARPSGKASLDAPLQAGRDYSALRSYGFGELFFSTRGVAADSLSSYIALRLDATAAPDTFRAPGQPATRIAPPIATWFERSTFEARTGWAEVKDFLPRRLGLRKLRVRAGSQYIYGPWVLHLDGALVAYDGDIASATAYVGGRHADYTTDLTNERYVVAGGSLRVDLRKLVALPIAITGETMSLTSYVADQPDSAHRQLAIDWQPRRDLTVTGQLRALDRSLASARLQLRARYREVTNLAFELVRRFSADWRWDPSLIAADDPTAARRYLDLGPVRPQAVASLRAGTLIAENVDLLVRGAFAADLTPSNATPPDDGVQALPMKSSFSAGYAELGGAVEVRLRRTFALGASALTRRTSRVDLPGDPVTGRRPGDPVPDVRLVAQPLPQSAATGERSFTELGARARMSLGARRLSALLEVYGRRTHYAALYADPTNPIPTSDLRGGGRVSVEAWIGPRLKLSAAYDATTSIDQSPEITLYKSLRLTMTGTY
jgi:hypothetical protein